MFLAVQVLLERSLLFVGREAGARGAFFEQVCSEVFVGGVLVDFEDEEAVFGGAEAQEVSVGHADELTGGYAFFVEVGAVGAAW